MFGVSLEQAWADWVADEHAFQRRNLEAIRKFPLTPYRDCHAARARIRFAGVLRSESDAIYAGLNYPGAIAHVARDFDEDRHARSARRHQGSADLHGDVTGLESVRRQVYYTTDNGAHRDLVRLDPATHRTRLLQKDARIGDLATTPRTNPIWGVRHLNGLCTLVRMKPPYTDWERVITWPYGTVMYDIDVSPDGTLVSGSFGEISGKQDVRVFEAAAMSQSNPTPVARFDFGTSVPSGFVFSPDGRYLLGSSYFTGVSNIFRYDLQARKVDAVSNTDTGFFRPVPIADGRLLVFRYTGRGFVPTWIDPKPLEDVSAITFFGEQRHRGTPGAQDLDAGLAGQGTVRHDGETDGRLSPRRRPATGIGLPRRPGLQGHGGRRRGVQPVGPADAQSAAFHRRMVARRRSRRPANAPISRPITSATTGAPARRSTAPISTISSARRRQDARAIERRWRHKTTLIFDEPRRLELDVSGSISGNLDRLPDYQNVPVDVGTLVTLEATLTFTDVRNSLGYVDDESGRKWSVDFQSDIADGDVLPEVPGNVRSRRRPSDWPLVDLDPRTAGGSPRATCDSPFANFFFGGFGNNYVDHGDEKRYRALRELSRRRAQRDRRPELRQGHGRMEPAALAVPRAGHAGLLRDVAAAGAVRHRPHHQHR